MSIMLSDNRADNHKRLNMTHKPQTSRKYGVCSECHNLEKLSGYICGDCITRITRRIYMATPERKAKAHDDYIKRKNKLSVSPRPSAACIGKGCLLDTVNTK
jgi:hypothetical protein